ncbi:2-dehydropantoate 2-reductase [Litorimonas cladophorae]|uniref:2-dehydropantoate 2-reductase n=1 Tax=Litorimonas cladophorae TaxID=1220491 RepID=A0A918NGB3_9PROT|nr:2-dehydropantoate 2-reductase [Litorimonas cladophorae]GGX68448.1 2-dehydropantoate 2-reductase [Litorimonas cladophorae]
MTKIAILGAGSIGCWLGGQLVAGGADVTLIGRKRYAKQIAENGLKLTHFERDEVYLPNLNCTTDAAVLADADIIGVCTKSQDTAAAAQQIAKFGKRGVTVISFQNGIRNVEILKDILPDHMGIIPAIVPFNVTPTGPGCFHSGTAGDLVLGSAPLPLLSAFQNSGQGVSVSGNIVGDQWAKMIVNLNNGLNTLTGGTLREGLMQRDYRRALALCVEEALCVADAAGVKVGTFNGRTPSALVKTLRLPNWAYGLVMQLIVKIDAKARSSMLDDLEAGRPSEIDFLQGEIVRQAEKAGVSAPKNAAIFAAVSEAFEKGISPKITGSEILALVKSTAAQTL